jgi:hypothetical protein
VSGPHAEQPKNSETIDGFLEDKVRGVFVGICAMRSQPAELRDVLPNASLNSNEERDYADDVGPYSSDSTVTSQNLYNRDQ